MRRLMLGASYVVGAKTKSRGGGISFTPRAERTTFVAAVDSQVTLLHDPRSRPSQSHEASH
jgi:hypothetical protein